MGYMLTFQLRTVGQHITIGAWVSISSNESHAPISVNLSVDNTSPLNWRNFIAANF